LLIVVVGALGCGRLEFQSLPGSCVAAYTAYGDQVCALRTDGALYCWGLNLVGQLGDGTDISRRVPAPAMIADVAMVASGETTVCAVKSDGSLWCWGGGTLGQIGDGGGVDRWLPAPVDLPVAIHEVDVSQQHVCVRLENGTGSCWGSNVWGALGSPPTPTLQLVPANAPVSGAVSMALGDNLTCLLRADRTVVCFGRNDNGQLGDGSTISRHSPEPLAELNDPIVQVTGGCHSHACAVTEPGDVWCWGQNQYGQLGRGTISAYEALPARATGISGAVQVGVGAFHACALTRGGEVWCWGINGVGELGDGTLDSPQPIPKPVPGITGTPVEVQASCSATVVRLDDDTLVGWGSAVQVGTLVDQTSPIAIAVPCP